jgi:regulator of sigma E protease
MSFLAVIFVFSLLVVIHELGHFFAAKLMGVRVERFSIGFPPRVVGKQFGDTDYCISAIPLGGYVKMSGMVDESMDSEITGADYEFNSKSVPKRMFIITAGVIMNFFLAVLILTFLSYSKGESVVPVTQIGAIGANGIAQKVGFQVGDEIKKINGAEVTTWNQIQQEFIRNLNDDITFTIVRDGQPLQLDYHKEWFSEEKAEQLDIMWMPSAKIGNALPGMPAAEAGLTRGDIVTAIDSIPVANWSEMTELIRNHPGQPVQVSYLRGSVSQTATLTPNSYEETDSTGAAINVGKIGIELYYDLVPVSFAKAVGNGFENTVNLIGLNMRALWWVITGTKSAKEIIGGPIMIAKMAGDAAAAGWDQLWYLIAALSAVLAFFNILPIPALDGGHLAMLIVEGITGKPVSTKAKLVVQQIGLAILLTFIVFILYVDLKRLFF